MGAARLATAYGNIGDCVRTDSIVNALRAVQDEMTEWDRTYNEHVAAWCEGNWEAWSDLGRRLQAIAPKSVVGKYHGARGAIYTHNRAKGVAELRALDPTGPSLRGNMIYYNDLTNSLHILADYKDDYRENLKVAREAIRNNPDRVHPLTYEIEALAGMGRGADAEAVLDKAIAMRPAPGDNMMPVSLVSHAATELRAHGDSVRATALNRRALLMLQSQTRAAGERIPEGDQWLITLYQLGRFAEARAMLDSVFTPNTGDRYAYYAWLGRLAARMGDTTTARLAMDSIERRTPPRFDRGASQYHRARIAAMLGKREETVALLRESFARGAPPVQYHRVRHFNEFEGMRDYPQLVELLRPRE